MLHYTLWQLRKINKSSLIDKILFSSHKRCPGSRARTGARRSAASCVTIAQLHGRARTRARVPPASAGPFADYHAPTETSQVLGTWGSLFSSVRFESSHQLSQNPLPWSHSSETVPCSSRLSVRYRSRFFLNCTLSLQLLHRAFPGSTPCGKSVTFGVRKTFVSWLCHSLALW